MHCPNCLKDHVKAGHEVCDWCERYYRWNFADADCPACGKTLDSTGRKHLDGTKCDER